MALKPCRECKSLVSDEAKICPNCGISKPIKNSTKWLWTVLGLIIFFVIISPKNSPQNAVVNAQNNLRPAQQTPSLLHTADLMVALNVSIVSNDRKPIIRVQTNLPENTIFMGSLANPVNQGGTGYFGETSSAVNNKLVELGPFSNNGDALPSGFYMVKISMSSLVQSQAVQSIIGGNGEKLKGGNVFTLAGMPARMVWQRFIFELKPDGSITNFQSSKNIEADSSLIPVEIKDVVEELAPKALVPSIMPSFDCSKAQSKAETLICSDTELARLDRELSVLQMQAKSVTLDIAAFKKIATEEWRKREKSCFDRDCVLNWYISRSNQLNEELSKHQDLAK